MGKIYTRVTTGEGGGEAENSTQFFGKSHNIAELFNDVNKQIEFNLRVHLQFSAT